MCDLLFKYSKNDAFRWKVQSVMQMSLLAAEHLDLIDINVVKSELSKEDRDMHIKNPISQAISRGDDDDLKAEWQILGTSEYLHRYLLTY